MDTIKTTSRNNHSIHIHTDVLTFRKKCRDYHTNTLMITPTIQQLKVANTNCQMCLFFHKLPSLAIFHGPTSLRPEII